MWADDWEDDGKDKERVTESLDWGKHVDKSKTDVNEKPSGAYNKLSEALRQSFPHEATCSMFCGGKKCKFCCADSWSPEDQVVKGLFSHWVTDNILAMSRPITRLIQEFDILAQFKEKGITAIINVQLPGEHAACGDGVHNEEFSYRQQDFMDSGVFFYNFGWKDFGVAESMTYLLDMVKVMQFAISEGKVAIHCHAGKGRTGVLIACFLVFHNRLSANEAVHYVRSRRPGSVQTGPQVKCVQDFEKFLKPYRVVFHQHTDIPSFNLSQYLMRQRGILHGYQARKLKFLPKIIYIICERLLRLAKKKELLHIPTNQSLDVELETSPNALLAKSATMGQAVVAKSTPEDPVLNLSLSNPRTHHSHVSKGIHGIGTVAAEVSTVGKALIEVNLTEEANTKILSYEKRLNTDDIVWDELRLESDPTVLATLMWHWLDQLKDPVVRGQDTELLFEHFEEPQKALDRFEKGAKMTVIYLMNFLVKLQPISEELECDILQRLISVLTHKSLDAVQISSISADELRASANSLMEMKDGEKTALFRFFYYLLETIEDDLEKQQTSNVT